MEECNPQLAISNQPPATSNPQPAQSAGRVTKGQCVNVLSQATIR
jgi:hypothetical protein